MPWGTVYILRVLSILIEYSTRETPKIDNIIDLFQRFDYCLVNIRNDSVSQHQE
jgi:hypothetical protein